MSSTDFKERDTFYINFGYFVRKFIVREVTEKGVIATAPSWLKRATTYISFAEMENDPAFSRGKPYSKLQWFLKL